MFLNSIFPYFHIRDWGATALPYPFNFTKMKLYIYHIPDYEKMWAVMADSPQAALVKVLSVNGDSIICQAGESVVLRLNKDVEHGK